MSPRQPHTTVTEPVWSDTGVSARTRLTGPQLYDPRLPQYSAPSHYQPHPKYPSMQRSVPAISGMTPYSQQIHARTNPQYPHGPHPYHSYATANESPSVVWNDQNGTENPQQVQAPWSQSPRSPSSLTAGPRYLGTVTDGFASTPAGWADGQLERQTQQPTYSHDTYPSPSSHLLRPMSPLSHTTIEFSRTSAEEIKARDSPNKALATAIAAEPTLTLREPVSIGARADHAPEVSSDESARSDRRAGQILTTTSVSFPNIDQSSNYPPAAQGAQPLLTSVHTELPALSAPHPTTAPSEVSLTPELTSPTHPSATAQNDPPRLTADKLAFIEAAQLLFATRHQTSTAQTEVALQEESCPEPPQSLGIPTAIQYHSPPYQIPIDIHTYQADGNMYGQAFVCGSDEPHISRSDQVYSRPRHRRNSSSKPHRGPSSPSTSFKEVDDLWDYDSEDSFGTYTTATSIGNAIGGSIHQFGRAGKGCWKFTKALCSAIAQPYYSGTPHGNSSHGCQDVLLTGGDLVDSDRFNSDNIPSSATPRRDRRSPIAMGSSYMDRSEDEWDSSSAERGVREGRSCPSRKRGGRGRARRVERAAKRERRKAEKKRRKMDKTHSRGSHAEWL